MRETTIANDVTFWFIANGIWCVCAHWSGMTLVRQTGAAIQFL